MEVVLVVDHYQAIPAKHVLCHKKHVMGGGNDIKKSKYNTKNTTKYVGNY